MELRANEELGVAEALPGTNTPVCNPTSQPGEEWEGEGGEALGRQATSSDEPTNPPMDMEEGVEPAEFNGRQ